MLDMSVEAGSSVFPEDAVLLEALRSGESEAAAILYQKHYPTTVEVSRKLVGWDCDAEDVASEAFTKTMEAIRRGNGPTVAMGSYLFTAVRSVVASRARIQEKPVDHEQLVYLLDSADPAPTRLSDEDELTTAFNSLNDDEQKIIWYHDIERMPVREIASLAGISPGAVSMRYMRARDRLREAYLNASVGKMARQDCVINANLLGRYSMRTLRPRAKKRCEEHLKTCRECSETAARLGNVAQRFLAAVAPMVAALSGGRTLSAHATYALLPAVLVPALLVPALLVAAVGSGIGGAAFLASGSASHTSPAALSVATGEGTCTAELGESGKSSQLIVTNTSDKSCLVSFRHNGLPIYTSAEVVRTHVLDLPEPGIYTVEIALGGNKEHKEFTVR